VSFEIEVDEREVWTRACWVCKVAISQADTGAWCGHDQHAWCKPCWARKMVAIEVGQLVAEQRAPDLSGYAAGSFGELVGDVVDGVEEGYYFFPCPEQSLHVFKDPDRLAAFDGRGRALEAAGLVEVVPGTDPPRHRISLLGRELLEAAGVALQRGGE
jgi:hypothetical protein